MATAILMPSIGPATRAGRLSRWLRRERDFVEAGEPVAEVAFPQGTMEVESPETGVLTHVLVAEGEEGVEVGSEIGTIEPGPPLHQRALGGAAPGRAGRVLASPRARRLAREMDVDLARLAGAGPNGRIVEADVRAALARAGALLRSGRGDGRLDALAARAEWIPQVSLQAECRVDALEARLDRINAAHGVEDAPVLLLDGVVRALALALEETPRANVLRVAYGFEPARQADVTLAVNRDGEAVALALRGADKMSLGEIARARAEFLSGDIPAGDVGGVCLVIGAEARRLEPLVVAPFTSAFGVGAAEPRVIVEQGAPTMAKVLDVTLSIDRRAMDEGAAGALLAIFKTLVERPERLVAQE
jgi:pyruvate dehydrogenase E2 component (dihydrolipoamide acetyltransferase)